MDPHPTLLPLLLAMVAEEQDEPIRPDLGAPHTPRQVLARLRREGVSDEVIANVLLPDWWADDCDDDPAFALEVEIPACRLFGVSLGSVQCLDVDLRACATAFVPWTREELVAMRNGETG